MNKKKNNKGFSLIELIIAIAILVILTGLLAPQFMKYIEKSREAKDVQAMDTVYSTVQAALANEAAYDDVIELTKGIATDKSYTSTLADLLSKKATSAFSSELSGLLGSADFSLKSSKATTDGEICIAIKYKEGTEKIKVPKPGTTTGETDDKEVEVFGGFEVMVYCGDGGANKIGDLQTIGAALPVDPHTSAGS